VFSQPQGYQYQNQPLVQPGQSSDTELGTFQSAATQQQPFVVTTLSNVTASYSQPVFSQPQGYQYQQQQLVQPSHSELGTFQSTTTTSVVSTISNVAAFSNQPVFSQPQGLQYQQQPLVQSDDLEFGVFQSTTTHQQPLVATTASITKPLHNLPQTNTTTYTNTQLVSSQVFSVVEQQSSANDEFGTFQSNNDHKVLSTNVKSSPSSPQADNRDSFGEFETFQSVITNEPTMVGSTQLQTSGFHNVVTSTVMPYWKRSFPYIPSLYHDVFVLCETGDGQFLDTKRLFPVLCSSGLQRSLLRDIWSAVNKVQPGKLTREELYQALGLIALVQVCKMCESVVVNSFGVEWSG